MDHRIHVIMVHGQALEVIHPRLEGHTALMHRLTRSGRALGLAAHIPEQASLCQTPELKSLSSLQIVALAGLAPFRVEDAWRRRRVNIIGDAVGR